MPEEFDYTTFGEDAETVRELCEKPEDIHKLLRFGIGLAFGQVA